MFWLNLLFCRFSYFAVNISNQTTVYNLLICNALNLKIPPPRKIGGGILTFLCHITYDKGSKNLLQCKL